MLEKPKDVCSGCPLYEKPYGKHFGYVPASGTGDNGVLVVLEAGGEDEEKEGMPLVGKAGYNLFQQLKRIDIDRERFRLHNVLSCRPPDNKILGMPYSSVAINKCSPLLGKTIEDHKTHCKAIGKTPVIIALGNIAFEKIVDLDKTKDRTLLSKDFYSYPFWSDPYKCWVIAGPHPAYLIRGNTHMWPVVHFVFQRALEIAKNGLKLDEPDYLLDPKPVQFDEWIGGYVASLVDVNDNPLSYDIETPYKKKTKDEEELSKEEDADHTILRCSFAYVDTMGATHTVSVKWEAQFMAGIEALFAVAPYVLGWNSDKYDHPRVIKHVDIKGIGLDGMVAWHILNSSLPKALGFVTPYYWQNTLMWKHLADKEPAFYNAKDADAALRNWIGIKRDLISGGLWDVYDRGWIELSKALKYMSGVGVLRDNIMRSDAEARMSTLLDEVELKMEEAVPVEAREIKIYKKAPKLIESGMYETVQDFKAEYCALCGVTKKNMRGKWHAKCGGTTLSVLLEPVKVWAKPLPFKISKKRMTSYQLSFKHQAIRDRKEKKVTFNADALTMLMKKYPNDKLYPTILEHRKVQKLLSTYVGTTNPNGTLRGGMQVGRDGRIHTQYGRDASTLRFTSEDPNLQNLPRPNPKDPSDLVNIIRNLVVAQQGSILYARDFSGIEAVLTGYFALDPRYIRLAKRDVHTYYTVYALYELEGGARIKAGDLPDLDWPDDRLFPYLAQLKKEFKKERDSLYKHLVHAANFGQGAMGARDKVYSETGVMYPVKTVQKVMDVYYALFPKIKQYHRTVLEQVEKDGYIRNPFGYVHRFNRPFDYKREFGAWVKKPGPDFNKIVAFGPQSTAVALITEAILRLYFHRFDEAGQYLRLQVHDELLFEIPRQCWEEVDKIVREEMERPAPQLRMPASWNMGDCLGILSEAKADLSEVSRWGNMKGL